MNLGDIDIMFLKVNTIKPTPYLLIILITRVSVESGIVSWVLVTSFKENSICMNPKYFPTLFILRIKIIMSFKSPLSFAI